MHPGPTARVGLGIWLQPSVPGHGVCAFDHKVRPPIHGRTSFRAPPPSAHEQSPPSCGKIYNISGLIGPRNEQAWGGWVGAVDRPAGRPRAWHERCSAHQRPRRPDQPLRRGCRPRHPPRLSRSAPLRPTDPPRPTTAAPRLAHPPPAAPRSARPPAPPTPRPAALARAGVRYPRASRLCARRRVGGTPGRSPRRWRPPGPRGGAGRVQRVHRDTPGPSRPATMHTRLRALAHRRLLGSPLWPPSAQARRARRRAPPPAARREHLVPCAANPDPRPARRRARWGSRAGRPPPSAARRPPPRITLPRCSVQGRQDAPRRLPGHAGAHGDLRPARPAGTRARLLEQTGPDVGGTSPSRQPCSRSSSRAARLLYPSDHAVRVCQATLTRTESASRRGRRAAPCANELLPPRGAG